MWDPPDNGTYTIAMESNQVSDTSENFVAAGILGTFDVSINDPPTVAAPISDLAVDEDAADWSIDLDGVFTDPDLSGRCAHLFGHRDHARLGVG